MISAGPCSHSSDLLLCIAASSKLVKPEDIEVSKVRIVKRKERKTFLDESGYMGQSRVCEFGRREARRLGHVC